jgi:hypothetical protein
MHDASRMHGVFPGQKIPILAVLLHYHCEPTGLDSLGQLANGFVQVRAPLHEVSVSRGLYLRTQIPITD